MIRPGRELPNSRSDLGPIDLNVLGLVIETSQICLKLTALEDGGLLGELLCAVGDLLSPGIPLNAGLADNATGIAF